MFCATCNLHYPDHLNYCRRCGQALVRGSGESAVESLCCTRCGARVVRGENFCQQCGGKVNAKASETVVGACYHCGTSWRSGWLFCKTCGLDRDRALTPPVSTPAGPAGSTYSPMGLTIEETPKLEKAYCQHCGSEAKPFSKFCESCGRPLAAPLPSDVEEVSERGYETNFEPPESSIESRRSRAGSLPAELDSEAATIEETYAPPPMTVTQETKNRRTTAFGRTNDTLNLRPSFATKVDEPAPPTGNLNTNTTRISGIPTRTSVELLEPAESEKRSERAAFQTLAIIGALLLLGGSLITWWFLKQKEQAPATERARPAVSTAEAQPSAAVSPGQQSGQSTGVASPEGMVYVPGGAFRMGRNDGDGFERPVHVVVVQPFYMDRTEVTNEEYEKFVAGTGYRVPIHWAQGKPRGGQEKFPVVNVSWDDAMAYANWVNKRLPTEAEWEFAARGVDNRLYPWGNDWNPNFANAGRRSGAKIVEVGRYNAGASPFGLLDLSGNVWEWTSSDLLKYSDKTQKIANGKVIRGGAYDVTRERATATYRGVVPPENRYDKTGFRCAKDAK